MEEPKDKKIIIYFAVAFLLAACIRLIGLATLPLSNIEAYPALQAFQLFKSTAQNEIFQPIYIGLTGINFVFWGGSDFLARFWPAVFGSLLVLIPFGFRKFLGDRVSIILAFCLAFDPAFVAASKQVNSTIIASGLLFFTLLAFYQKKKILTGLFFILSLMSGSSVWLGILIISISIWLNSLLNNRAEAIGNEESTVSDWRPSYSSKDWINVGKGALIGIIIAGTFFFTKPELLSGVVSGFVEFLRGWTRISTLSTVSIIFIILAYEFVPLILGIMGVVRGIQFSDATDKFLGRWLLVSSILVLFYPAHQLFDLLWLIVPLLILGSRQIERIRIILNSLQGADYAFGGLIVVLLGFTLLSVGNFFNQITGSVEYIQGLAGMIAGTILIAVTALLVAWGWRAETSKRGLIIGFSLLALIVCISTSIRAAGLGRYPIAELWNDSAIPVDADIAKSTIQDISLWKSGVPNNLSIIKAGQLSASMAWYFRDFKNFSSEIEIAAGNVSDVVINDGAPLTTPTAYRGQDFVWERSLQKKDVGPLDWINWMLYRKAKYVDQSVVVWVRTDLFPGYAPEESLGNKPIIPSK